MGRWITYVRERFQLLPQMIMIIGLALIAKPLQGFGERFGWVVAALFLFFFLLRAMDEYKDYEKDCVAHPKRPLPRGLIAIKEMRAVIRYLLLGMLGLSAFFCLKYSLVSGALYGIVTVYLWAMFHEFFWWKPFLNRRPLLYAISHQLIVVPLTGFLVSVGGLHQVISPKTAQISMVLLGGFFVYEICRKLDIRAHPSLQTYPQVFGTWLSALIAGIVLCLACFCGWLLGIGYILVPVAVILLCSLLYYCVNPAKYKIAEIVSAVNLLTCIYSLGMVTI